VPELPDLTVYLDHLNNRLTGTRLVRIHLASPFVLRSVSPGVDAFENLRVEGCRRLAKQLVIGFEGDFYMVIHLMISGRLQWSDTFKPPPKRVGLAAFEFEAGTLMFTEASKKKRASLRLMSGRDVLNDLNPGGLEVLEISLTEFADQLRDSNHTLKRALTDQRVFAGIGNAYSDEILLRAKLSPFKRPRTMKDDEIEHLFDACRVVLTEWTQLLRDKSGETFPKKVTAFHDEMAVHGKYKKPCPVCGSPVQRIVYAENESNYCAKCQTGSRLLADRSLSRLLKDNWPKRLEDLEG
jgi:formamidopyrimidine-DNA glycosylase